MESALTGFVRVLRNAELRVSPAETLDAARAMELVGYADRDRLREVLSATLAKTVPEKALFDECFARFFAPPIEKDSQTDSEPPPQASSSGDAQAANESAVIHHVGLHDVEGAAHQPGLEGLAPRQHLTAGDGHRAGAAQVAEIVDGVAGVAARLHRVGVAAAADVAQHGVAEGAGVGIGQAAAQLGAR